MPEARPSIFNKTATEKLRSPDDLDKYIQVTNPSIWVVLLACAALLVGLLAWGVFGTVTTNVAATGTMIDGKVVCFMDAEDASKVHVDDAASTNGEKLVVTEISAIPLSRKEASANLANDYLESALIKSDWSYKVVLGVDGHADQIAQGVPIPVNIAVESVAPISLVLGSK